jgi:hypothetical protein
MLHTRRELIASQPGSSSNLQVIRRAAECGERVMPSTLEPSPDMAGWSSSQLRDWAEGLEGSRAPRDVNWWLDVRWTPQQHAYDTALAGDVRRDWADVFLLFVDCMERFTTYDRWNAAADRFHMRALLIRQLGQVDGSTTWNADALTHDVLAMLTLSPTRARQQVHQWRSPPIDQIRTLRHHKNVLAPLESVADLVHRSPHADLVREWLALRPDLP